MQTTFKKVKLAGHEDETEVTVRHRSTLGRFEATSKDYPHLTGEGDTEALALKDLGEPRRRQRPLLAQPQPVRAWLLKRCAVSKRELSSSIPHHTSFCSREQRQ